jgi:hypothetical protein
LQFVELKNEREATDMKAQSSTKKFMLLLVCSMMLLTMSLMAGCKGSDGANGSNGADLTTGTVDSKSLTFDDLRNTSLSGKILSVSTADNQPKVTFQVIDNNTGEGVSGLRTFSLHIAQLQPEANGSNSFWLNYITSHSNTSTAFRPTTDPVSTFDTNVNSPTYGAMTKQGYSVVDKLDGTYVVTFASNIKSGATATWGTTTYNPASAT